MEQVNRRGEIAALFGMVVQAIVAAAMLVIGYWWNLSLATVAAGWYMVGGIGIWAMVLLVFHQQKMQDLERLETEQLRRHREATGKDAAGLFGLPGEEGGETLIAGRRLRWIRRWLLPIATVLIAAYEIAAALAMLKWHLRWPVGSEEWPAVADPNVTVWFVAGIAFLCFLFSRYTSGMARQPEWRLLRAGASYLFGSALAALAVVVMLALIQLFGAAVPEHYLAYVLPIAMAAIGVEFALNFVLDIYRPRAPGAEYRPSFDSRLLGLFSEPGGLAHTLAEAINYQFGFEVSRTWFYQLLQRAITPLIAFGILTMLLLSCVVIVESDEQAIVERFGNPLHGRAGVLGPGFYLKLPSPIDRAYKYPVERVKEIVLGFSKDAYTDISPEELARQLKLVLWTSERHGPAPELPIVAASKQVTEQDGESAVVPSLLKINAPLQYRISDVFDYHFNYTNPQEVLEAIAYRELVLYIAGTDLDELLGADRTRAAEHLMEHIQRRADELRLGVTISFTGVHNIHPPQEEQVAETFQKVIGALAEKEAYIRQAEAQENKILAEVAGTKKLALDLVAALEHLESLRDSGTDAARLSRAQQRVNRLFNGYYEDQPDGGKRFRPGVAGQAFALVAEAQAYRWRRENAVQGKAERFDKELAAFRASPRFFKLRKYLKALNEGLKDARKYVVAADAEKIPMVIEMDLKTIPRPELETFEVEAQ
jgi:regulator of protease activity HflC (stomatin/prohibitin superfamily)